MRRDRYDYPSPQEPALPLGRRLARFCALLAALFAITAAIIVTQRLSRDSLALLIGLSCGVMAMLPTLALGLLTIPPSPRSSSSPLRRSLGMATPAHYQTPNRVHGNGPRHAVRGNSKSWGARTETAGPACGTCAQDQSWVS